MASADIVVTNPTFAAAVATGIRPAAAARKSEMKRYSRMSARNVAMPPPTSAALGTALDQYLVDHRDHHLVRQHVAAIHIGHGDACPCGRIRVHRTRCTVVSTCQREWVGSLRGRL